MADTVGEFADKVIGDGDLMELLGRFGMVVNQMAYALVGTVEAHATRAEDAYRTASTAC